MLWTLKFPTWKTKLNRGYSKFWDYLTVYMTLFWCSEWWSCGEKSIFLSEGISLLRYSAWQLLKASKANSLQWNQFECRQIKVNKTRFKIILKRIGKQKVKYQIWRSHRFLDVFPVNRAAACVCYYIWAGSSRLSIFASWLLVICRYLLLPHTFLIR